MDKVKAFVAKQFAERPVASWAVVGIAVVMAVTAAYRVANGIPLVTY